MHKSGSGAFIVEQPASSPVPRSLKERHRQEREQLILQVAEEVIGEKGYYESSVDEIAARVGIAKGTIYLHFPSKEDLVMAIIKRDIEQLVARIDEIKHQETSARQRMEAILQAMYGDTFVQRMRLISSILNTMDSPNQLKERGEKLKGLWDYVAESINGLLEEGKAAGEFDPALPTPIMLNSFLSLMSPRSYDRLIVNGKMSGQELTDSLGRFYFKGIAHP